MTDSKKAELQNSQKTKKKRIKMVYAGVVLVAFFVNLLVFMLFEHQVFNETFDNLSEYMIILIPWISVFTLLSFILPRLPDKVIFTLFFCVQIGIGLIWLTIAFYLPVDQVDFGCNYWVCEISGQTLMAVLTVSINPILCYEWFGRIYRRGNHSKTKESIDIDEKFNIFTTIIILITGAIITILGLISFLGYYWVVFINSILVLLSSILILIGSKKSILLQTRQNKTKISKKSPKIRIGLNRILRDLFFIAFIGLMSFAMYEDDVFMFGELIGIGLGICLLGTLMFILQEQNASIKFEKILEITFYMGVVLGFGIVLSIIIMNPEDYNQMMGDILIPGVLIGFLIGYFYHRIDLLLQHKNLDAGMLSIQSKFISRDWADFLALEIWLSGLVVLSFFQINPEPEDLVLIIAAGILLIIISSVLWFFAKIASEKRKNV